MKFKILLAATYLAIVVVPIAVVDFYPFTLFPMFTDSPSTLGSFRIYSSSGTELSAPAYEIHSNYLWSSIAVLRQAKKNTLNASPHQEIFDERAIVTHFSDICNRKPNLFYDTFVLKHTGMTKIQANVSSGVRRWSNSWSLECHAEKDCECELRKIL